MTRQTPPTRKDRFPRSSAPRGALIKDQPCDGSDCDRPARCRARAASGALFYVCKRCWKRVQAHGNPNPPPNPLDLVNLDLVNEMRANGRSWANIAAALGKPRSTIYKAARRA